MEYKYSNENIKYLDTKDHFENGFLRLLSITHEGFHEWMSFIPKEGDVIHKLTKSFREYRYCGTEYSNEVWFEFIGQNTDFGITYSENGIAYLARREDNKYIKETSPPEYEADYFEGNKVVFGGYGEYINQVGWRIEKSNRQIIELIDVIGMTSPRILDVGSGYGYFRKAAENAGLQHSGIEISKHAASVCNVIYGFNTYVGTLEDYSTDLSGQFDVVTLWDVIEHLPDPISFLSHVNKILKPGGFVVLKTPNIDCPEVDIFGPYYHSFKREHLVYFSHKGLINCANRVGFIDFKSTSISHLLKGFLGERSVKQLADVLRGSDLLVYLRKET